MWGFSSALGSSSLSGRKRKRASQWSDAPSKDELAIAEAMASFSDSSSQDLTEAQKLQLKEQMEVREGFKDRGPLVAISDAQNFCSKLQALDLEPVFSNDIF